MKIIWDAPDHIIVEKIMLSRTRTVTTTLMIMTNIVMMDDGDKGDNNKTTGNDVHHWIYATWGGGV
jgi:hypothetical protein